MSFRATPARISLWGKGDDHLDGGTGQDHIQGAPATDTIFGGPGGEPVTESDPHGHHEYVSGGAGNDVIVIRGAGTILHAGAGDDRIDMRDPQDRCKLPLRELAGRTRKLDLLNTGAGHNFVRADDANYDGIDCFRRRDRVLIDRYDHVSECEVVRPRKPG